jgi:predicted transcriptional regulator of viral defense system
MKKPIYTQILDLIEAKQVIRPKDLSALGIPGQYLSQMAKAGLIEKIDRGLYASPNRELNENVQLIEITQKVPNAVICLLSVLRFHELTTQAPFETWIAIDRKARRPEIQYPPTRIVTFSSACLSEGIEVHEINGVNVKMFSIEKTIADCFKYRNKIGIDVAVEALKEAINEDKITLNDLWHYSKICRVGNIIRPYVEALL